MKKKDLVVKILAGLLVAGMLIGLLPMFASAAETNDGTRQVDAGTTTTQPEGDIYLNKTAVLQADGTWTITLEAYATGTVKSEVRTQVTPTDIILVLDQSGSMENSSYYIEIGAGTYTAVSNSQMPTNEQMMDGDYYFWDANDQKYYRITTTRHIVSEDTYWVYSKNYGDHKAGDRICLESEAAGKIGTSWSTGGYTAEFELGYGYLLTDYLLYQRGGSSRNYKYTLVSHGSGFKNVTQTPVSGASSSSNAYNSLVNYVNNNYKGLDVVQQTFGSTYYRSYFAFAYVPVELKNADVYYYTYTYKDDMGQVWTIGHSKTDTGTDVNIADAKYDTSLGKIYVENTRQGPRLDALKSAANSFISSMQKAAVEHKVDHRIAVVGFSGNGVSKSASGINYQYMNSELFIGANQYNYYDGAAGDPASRYYNQAFQSVSDANDYARLVASINALEGEGPTYASVGFLLAQGVAKANANTTTVTDDKNNTTTTNDYISGKRKLVVVFMTDGEPGWSGYEQDEDELINSKDNDTTINGTGGLAKELEDTYGATIYTVALLDKAPSSNSVDNFLKNSATKGSYTLATDGVSLTNFFHTIEFSVDNIYSTVQLSNNAFMVDRVSEYFNMPADMMVDADKDGIPEGLKNYVDIYTAEHLGNHTFGTWDKVDYEISASADKEQNDDKIHIWATTGAGDGLAHGITVHNFDYLGDNMVTTQRKPYDDKNDNGEFDEGDVLLKDGETATNIEYTNIAGGRKLVVVIRGITAKDSAALDYYIPTNDEHSGLWDTADNGVSGKLKEFPHPQTHVFNRIYVLDYAKTACLASLDVTRKALALDQANDAIISPVDINNTAHDALSTSDVVGYDENGKAITALKFGDAYIENSSVYYLPKTTNWYGYDSFYIFWQASNAYDTSGNLIWSEGDPVTGYCWSKASVMPANNVYFEDTFISTKVDGEYVDSTTQGRVGIEFGDGWSFKMEDTDGTLKDVAQGTEGPNTEKPESAGQDETFGIHGWVDSLSDEKGYTDGTVAVGDGKEQANASFVFTGTGVDIYSYTNETTGTIIVKVAPMQVRSGYSVPTRYYIVDNYAASGDYYSIPTVSYVARGTRLAYTDDQGAAHPAEENVLVYGQYEVTITVTTAAEKDGGRVVYYLDGIRVYNPLGSEKENDPLVGEGYGKEVHAFFYNIGDYLISQGDFDVNGNATGAVFIDQIKPGQTEDGTETGVGVTTHGVGTYSQYGPKHEIYLAGKTTTTSETTDENGNPVTTTTTVPGQMVVMKVEVVEGRRWFLSLNAPTGTATTASISHTDSAKAVINVNHASDLFYEVIPVNVTTDSTTGKQYGYIAIENTGEALLAVNQYQITGLDPNPHDNIETQDTAVDAISDDEAVTFARSFALLASTPYTGETNSGETPSDKPAEDTQEPESPDIEITNPETPDEPSFEDEVRETIESLVTRLFISVRNWF
jgi:hypothetical protein